MAFTKKRSVAVTGAGSGLGRDIALGLAAKDYRVFGTAMSPEEIADIKQASGGAVTLSRCDITDETAVKGWASEVRAKTEGKLNLLISNAGILTPGPLEVLPLSAFRREFDVNVFGALAVVNAFLPALRRHAGESYRSAPGPPACRFLSTGRQVHRRLLLMRSQPATAPS